MIVTTDKEGYTAICTPYDYRIVTTDPSAIAVAVAMSKFNLVAPPQLNVQGQIYERGPLLAFPAGDGWDRYCSLREYRPKAG